MSSASADRPVQWRRAVTVEALDASGGRAVGTELLIAADAAALGAVTVGASAVRLEFENPAVTLLITARFWGETATALLPPGLNEYTFHFRAVSRGVYAGPGTARCPDGTAGQPCVDCNINGSIVRICA
jgi:hypothetical protein